MSGDSIILPGAKVMTGVQHRLGAKFISVSDLIAYLRKAALDDEQHPVSAQAFAMLADELEKNL